MAAMGVAGDAKMTAGERAAVSIGPAGPDVASVRKAMEEGIIAIDRVPRRGDRWAIKLNLTYPRYLPGVVNAPAFVDALCQWGRDHGVKLLFVEGDGGNGSYSAQDTFDGNGIAEMARQYDMSCVSLSETPWDWRETMVAGRLVRLPYSPFFRRREYDVFATAPVFKNHVFTIVSLGMKNLWGCIPDAYRMYYHHVLDHGIVALAKELRPDIAIFDGLIGLRGRGPMDGEPVVMNALMLAATTGAGERAALEVMGIPPAVVRHLSIARDEGLLPLAEELDWKGDPGAFRRSDFILDRSLLNHISIWIGKSPSLQRLIYHSNISPALYAIVNPWRRNSSQAKLSRAKQEGAYSRIPPPGH
jgi:uncharacterized protein (DUF362 family)